MRVRPKQPLTHAEVTSMLRYEPDTGRLFWKVSRGGRLAGDPVGTVRPDGYLSVGMRDNKLLVHRLIWFLVTGVWPENDIDHVNGLRTDNRLVNLRAVSRAQNLQNLDANNLNNQTTGLVGASYDKGRRNFRSYIVVGRKQINLGRFSTGEAAHAAYLKAKSVIHTHHDRMLGEHSDKFPC